MSSRPYGDRHTITSARRGVRFRHERTSARISTKGDASRVSLDGVGDKAVVITLFATTCRCTVARHRAQIELLRSAEMVGEVMMVMMMMSTATGVSRGSVATEMVCGDDGGRGRSARARKSHPSHIAKSHVTLESVMSPMFPRPLHTGMQNIHTKRRTQKPYHVPDPDGMLIFRETLRSITPRPTH